MDILVFDKCSEQIQWNRTFYTIFIVIFNEPAFIGQETFVLKLAVNLFCKYLLQSFLPIDCSVIYFQFVFMGFVLDPCFIFTPFILSTCLLWCKCKILSFKETKT